MELKQKGQATIEYLMLFTVTLFIAGGLMFQFNDAFRNFANNYFGAYLSCLLESGELPSLGWEARGSNDDSCDSDFQPFNLASGRVPVTGKYSYDSTPLPPGNPQPPNFGGGSPPPPENNPTSAGGGASETKASTLAAGPSSGGGGQGGGSSQGPTAFGAGPSSAKNSDGSDQAPREGANSDGAYAGVGARGSSGRQQFVPLSKGESDIAEGEKKRIVPANEVDVAREVRRVPADDLRKKKPIQIEEPEFTLMDFVKYILIIGIIIAMVIFLGGQAVQISKSRDK